MSKPVRFCVGNQRLVQDGKRRVGEAGVDPCCCPPLYRELIPCQGGTSLWVLAGEVTTLEIVYQIGEACYEPSEETYEEPGGEVVSLVGVPFFESCASCEAPSYPCDEFARAVLDDDEVELATRRAKFPASVVSLFAGVVVCECYVDSGIGSVLHKDNHINGTIIALEESPTYTGGRCISYSTTTYYSKAACDADEFSAACDGIVLVTNIVSIGDETCQEEPPELIFDAIQSNQCFVSNGITLCCEDTGWEVNANGALSTNAPLFSGADTGTWAGLGVIALGTVDNDMVKVGDCVRDAGHTDATIAGGGSLKFFVTG